MKKKICILTCTAVILLVTVLLVTKFMPKNSKPAATDTKTSSENNGDNISEDNELETEIILDEPEVTEPPSIEIVMVGDMLMHERVIEPIEMITDENGEVYIETYDVIPIVCHIDDKQACQNLVKTVWE